MCACVSTTQTDSQTEDHPAGEFRGFELPTNQAGSVYNVNKVLCSLIRLWFALVVCRSRSPGAVSSSDYSFRYTETYWVRKVDPRTIRCVLRDFHIGSGAGNDEVVVVLGRATPNEQKAFWRGRWDEIKRRIFFSFSGRNSATDIDFWRGIL